MLGGVLVTFETDPNIYSPEPAATTELTDGFVVELRYSKVGIDEGSGLQSESRRELGHIGQKGIWEGQSREVSIGGM